MISSCDLLKNSYLCLLNNTTCYEQPAHYSVVICWKIRIFAYWTTPCSLSQKDIIQLWFAEKFVSLLIEQHLLRDKLIRISRCDLLKNSYLCLLNNTMIPMKTPCSRVVICWKIRIFAYWTTPASETLAARNTLWFAEKFVSLLIEQHLKIKMIPHKRSCDLLKNSYLCLLNNTIYYGRNEHDWLWFAEKFVSLLIEQHPKYAKAIFWIRCDLLKNSYLCLLNNTGCIPRQSNSGVVICWKIRIFAYWTTPNGFFRTIVIMLWFAEKFVSLLIEQHPECPLFFRDTVVICWKIRIFAYWTTPVRQSNILNPQLWFAEKFVSLLIEQHPGSGVRTLEPVVICWKIRIFAYWTTPSLRKVLCRKRCDLLKNSYLCLLNNTWALGWCSPCPVVICWKIRIFAYWTTPQWCIYSCRHSLWFAEKFVSLLIEQHQDSVWEYQDNCCDLLKNSYLCLLNNTHTKIEKRLQVVVICWKIRIFAYWTTPACDLKSYPVKLWFAEKFVSLLIEQHHTKRSTKIGFGCDLLKNSYLCLLNNTRLCRSGSIWECCKQWQKWEKSHAWRKKPQQTRGFFLLAYIPPTPFLFPMKRQNWV